MTGATGRATTTRLFCIPYSGASALVYARWRRMLPYWIAVRPVELPGRGARMDEPLATDPHRLAEQLAGELAGEIGANEASYALFGHSLGALLAYEMALALRDRGVPSPLVLFASGTEAPSVRDDACWRRARSDAELIEELRAKQGTPEEAIASPEIMEAVLPVLRADFLMCGHYAHSPRVPLPCPIRVLGGAQDETSHEGLEAWRRETAAGFGLSLFEGGHFFIQERQAEVLALIESDLAHALDASACGPPAGAGRAA